MSYDEDESLGVSAYGEYDDNDEPLDIPDDVTGFEDDLDEDPDSRYT